MTLNSLYNKLNEEGTDWIPVVYVGYWGNFKILQIEINGPVKVIGTNKIRHTLEFTGPDGETLRKRVDTTKLDSTEKTMFLLEHDLEQGIDKFKKKILDRYGSNRMG